jgi:hypothetical protein
MVRKLEVLGLTLEVLGLTLEVLGLKLGTLKAVASRHWKWWGLTGSVGA